MIVYPHQMVTPMTMLYSSTACMTLLEVPTAIFGLFYSILAIFGFQGRPVRRMPTTSTVTPKRRKHAEKAIIIKMYGYRGKT
jgi:hypothetical protein